LETVKLEALSEIEIFQDLSDQEMEEMDRSTTMSTCESGRVFYGPDEAGEVLFLLKKGRVQLYRLSPEGKKLVVAVLEKGQVALRFLESMAIRLRETEAKLEDLAFKSIPVRLAALLQDLAGESNSGDTIEGYTHQDLAEMLGTYRETATQTLNEFKSHGWVEIGRKRIRIVDPSALDLQAQP
jgi:CRP-like cAMP-binding protein